MRSLDKVLVCAMTTYYSNEIKKLNNERKELKEKLCAEEQEKLLKDKDVIKLAELVKKIKDKIPDNYLKSNISNIRSVNDIVYISVYNFEHEKLKEIDNKIKDLEKTHNKQLYILRNASKTSKEYKETLKFAESLIF